MDKMEGDQYEDCMSANVTLTEMASYSQLETSHGNVNMIHVKILK